MEKQGKTQKSNNISELKKPNIKPLMELKQRPTDVKSEVKNVLPEKATQKTPSQKTKKISNKMRKIFEQRSGKIQ